MSKRSYTQFNQVVDQLLGELLGLSRRAVKGNEQAKLRTSVETLVRDTVAISFGRERRGLASIRKGRSPYSTGQITNPKLTYRIHVERAYQGLVELGYLEEVLKGASDGTVGKFLTRYRAAPKLLGLFPQDALEVLPVIIPPDESSEQIRVRETSTDERGRPVKRLIDYATRIEGDTAERVEAMRDRLGKINRLLLAHWYDLELEDSEFEALQNRMLDPDALQSDHDPHINLANRSLHRIFLDTSFKTGGRFYGGWWQSIPSEYRSLILIDGKQTVELDYGGLHPTILYAQAGLEAPQDPYSDIRVGGLDSSADPTHRKIVKRAFNAMLNNKGPLKAQPKGFKLSDFGTRWGELSSAIIERHESIANRFYTGVGLELQYLDSQFAEHVMLYMDGYPVLPIHDSFVVHHGLEAKLRDVMTEAFNEVMQAAVSVDRNSTALEATWRRTSLDKDEKKPASPDVDRLLGITRKGFYFRQDAFWGL